MASHHQNHEIWRDLGIADRLPRLYQAFCGFARGRQVGVEVQYYIQAAVNL
jgi:hypothetical protein